MSGEMVAQKEAGEPLEADAGTGEQAAAADRQLAD